MHIGGLRPPRRVVCALTCGEATLLSIIQDTTGQRSVIPYNNRVSTAPLCAKFVCQTYKYRHLERYIGQLNDYLHLCVVDRTTSKLFISLFLYLRPFLLHRLNNSTRTLPLYHHVEGLEEVEKHPFDSGNWTKLFNKNSPGRRVYPPNTKTENAEHQVRIDAGETVNGYKIVYLQVNSEATNTALKKYVSKYGTHSNVAAAKIPVEIPEDKREEVVHDLLADFRKKFSSKIG